MKLLITFVSVLFLFMGATVLNADDVIKPLWTYSGKQMNEAIRAEIPKSKMITDHKTLAKLWKSLVVPAPMPLIDWNKELVLIDSVSGPNRISLTDMHLNRQNGNLRFACIGTKMGGPGFGYVLVRIPKMGIARINGVEVPNAVVGKPAIGAVADGITVEMVGKIQTGLMAIGGETTGTIITSDNVTFEIDLSGNRGLRSAAEALNNKRGKVKGKLTKKAGVEIRERWILKAESIEAVDGILKPGLPGVGKKAFKEVKFAFSGGFAGFDQEVTITGNGKASRINRLTRVTESWDLTPDALGELHALIGKTDWSKIPNKTPGQNPIADGMSYQFKIDTGKGVFRFSKDDSNLAQSLELLELSRLLRR